MSTGPATATPGFVDSLGLACGVVPLAGQSSTTVPTCALTAPVNPSNPNVKCNTTTNTCTIVGGLGGVVVTVTATATTPVGLYQVQVTATDQAVPTLAHATALVVNVVNSTSAVNVIPGNVGTTTANFIGPASTTPVTLTFTSASCVSVTGSGLNVTIPAGGEAPSVIGISCSFSPASITLTGTSTAGGIGSVTVSVNTATGAIARLSYPNGIFAATWLGLPGIVLLGSLRNKRRSRRSLMQVLGILLVLVALLQGIGCGGGGFTKQPTVSGTPTGAYLLLVQVQGSDQATYSAVIPVNVGH